MFQIPDVSSDVNSINMIRNKVEIRTRKHSSNGALCAPLDIAPLLPLTFFSIFGLSLFFCDSLTFYFYFFDISSSLRSAKELTIENMT